MCSVQGTKHTTELQKCEDPRDRADTKAQSGRVNEGSSNPRCPETDAAVKCFLKSPHKYPWACSRRLYKVDDSPMTYWSPISTYQVRGHGDHHVSKNKLGAALKPTEVSITARRTPPASGIGRNQGGKTTCSPYLRSHVGHEDHLVVHIQLHVSGVHFANRSCPPRPRGGSTCAWRPR